MNLTITVMPPLNINDDFKNFWSTYGQPISIIMGGFAGGFASLIFGRVKKNLIWPQASLITINHIAGRKLSKNSSYKNKK
jgi:hypothetical protein